VVEVVGRHGEVDLLQNVLAAKRATLSANGETHEVIDAAALPMLLPRRRRRYERLGIAQYLKLEVV
jgi:hypothetical protein